MEAVLLIIRLALFGIFALAGVGKLLDLKGSEKAVKAFGTPEPFVKPFSRLIPIAELVFAFCFLFAGTSWVGAIGGLLLMVTFIGGMLMQMIGGKEADCHCFGQIHSGRVGPKTLIRNLAIAVLPIVLIVSGRSNQGYALGESNAQTATNVAVAMIAVSLVVVASYLAKLLKDNKILTRKLELFEMLDNAGQEVERDEIGDPRDSLPIGAPLPPFSLPDAAGKNVTNQELSSNGLPTFYLFVGPNCDPCKSLVSDFASWKTELSDRVNFVIISKGFADDNREMFGESHIADMLLQRNNEYARRLFVYWTPAALFVSANGLIASHPAVGDDAIRRMIDTIRAEKVVGKGFYITNPSKHGSIKIGNDVRSFNLKDADGNTVTEKVFGQKPTLVFFLSKDCSYCAELVDQLKIWEASPDRNGTNAVVFSDGDAEYARGYGLSIPVLLDKDHRIADGIGMYGTPSGVLIDENAQIVSETAIGSGMIWSLIGRHLR